MAVINTIREKMGTFVVIAVGIAILSFVIADLLGPQSSLFNSGADRTIGEIAGEEVTLDEFQRKLDELEMQVSMQNGGRNITEQQRTGLRNQAWEALVAEKAFGREYEELGLLVTDEELIDMVQGNNISPSLRATFVNPETGEFDRNLLINYLQNVRNMAPQDQVQWYAFEATLRPSRQRLKYENLILKSSFVTSAEARNEHKSQNSVAEVQYLYVPFYAVSDSAVQVTDDDLKSYLNKNKARFTTEGGRSIKYVSFPIQPSPEDRESFTRDLNSLKNDFASANNDSLFALNNTEGGQAFSKYAPDQLPAQLRSVSLKEGEVYGPFANGTDYTLYKVSAITEDTISRVKASHILISSPESSTAEEKKAAREKADALLKRARAGENFSQLARENSDDPSSSRGGDLGWFSEGRMVEPFEKAVFDKKDPGLVTKVVETNYGFHIINVTEAPTKTAYKIAKIETDLAPSQSTRNQAYRKAELFASSVENQKEFDELVQRDTLTAQTARNIGRNDRRINDIYDARSAVMWAYNSKTSVGDVSEVYELDDRYLVAVLIDKTEKGTAKLVDVRDEITAAVKNEKKAKLITDKLNSINGSLEEKAEEFGSDANIYTASSLRPGDFSLNTVGYAPAAVGAAFGLNEGEISQPIEAQNGMVIIKTISKTEAQEIADYSGVKEQIAQRRENRIPFLITEAVKEAAEIEDKRYKFF